MPIVQLNLTLGVAGQPDRPPNLRGNIMAKKKVIEPEEISKEEIAEEVEIKEEVAVVSAPPTEVVIQNKAWRIKMGLQEE